MLPALALISYAALFFLLATWRFLASEESPLREPAAIMFQDPDEQIFAASVARELSLGRPAVQVAATLDAFGLAGLAEQDPRVLSAGLVTLVGPL